MPFWTPPRTGGVLKSASILPLAVLRHYFKKTCSKGFHYEIRFLRSSSCTKAREDLKLIRIFTVDYTIKCII